MSIIVFKNFKDYFKAPVVKNPCALQQILSRPDLPSSFFDGACNNKMYGGGMVLHLSSNHSFPVKNECWVGTTNRVELLVLWGLLSFACSKNIQELQIFGDSKIIVDWTRVLQIFRYPFWGHWCSKIRRLFNRFKLLPKDYYYIRNSMVLTGLARDVFCCNSY